MIVMKFGGSSLESPQALRRVASIIQGQLERQPIVVVSAMAKTTDRLLESVQLAAHGRLAAALLVLEQLERYHLQQATDLAGTRFEGPALSAIGGSFSELRGLAAAIARAGETPKLSDSVAVHGEHLSAQLVALCLQAHGMPGAHLDARTIIRTDSRHTRAAPILPETYSRVRAGVSMLPRGVTPVLGGFIGSSATGAPSTLGRGGSDFTASLVGAAIDAAEIQIWTDVDGMLTCDPRLVPASRLVRAISYGEAADLARFGARVLHPETVTPAIEKSIPIVIRNSRRPAGEGTRISGHFSRPGLKAIACKSGLALLTVRARAGASPAPLLDRAAGLIWRSPPSAHVMCLSESVASLAFEEGDARQVCLELNHCGEMELHGQLSVICIVGGRPENAAMMTRISRALAAVPVRMLCPDAARGNLAVILDQQDLTKGARALHHELFEDGVVPFPDSLAEQALAPSLVSCPG